MPHEDLTPKEREALELLRNNASEAPTALASLDEVGRARVLRALCKTGMRVSEPTGEEPSLETAPGSQYSSPVTFADRVWAPTVTVAGKQVPVIPSSTGIVVMIVALILLVRACVGAGSAAWCGDLDEMIDWAWTYEGGYDGGRGTVNDMSRTVRAEFRDSSDYTEEAMASLNDALEEAWSASTRYDGAEAARAWEDALRGAC